MKSGDIGRWSLDTAKRILTGRAVCSTSQYGKTVASASDAGTGAALQTLEGHTGSVSAVAFSPEGITVASAWDDKTVQL